MYCILTLLQKHLWKILSQKISNIPNISNIPKKEMYGLLRHLQRHHFIRVEFNLEISISGFGIFLKVKLMKNKSVLKILTWQLFLPSKI